MPDEPIETRRGNLLPPYLVEARSIGGLSGSPVFWYRGLGRVKSGGWQFSPSGPLFYLLGLVHGHFAEKEIGWDSNESVLDVGDTRSINMGIAIVRACA